MTKRYIEFILSNEEHMNEIRRLDNYVKGNHSEGSKEHDKDYIEREFRKLIEDNYYFDSDCDPYYVIGEGYESAIGHNVPRLLILAIEGERKRRHTRKRHPKKSWQRLRELGLEE